MGVEMTETTKTTRGPRQVKVGTVVSNKMNETVVVSVERPAVHRLYHRLQKRTTTFHAHDEGNRCGIGDRVEIVSTRPLSKTKRWRVRQVLKKAEES
jgi:small subunit ribosomal protein S17